MNMHIMIAGTEIRKIEYRGQQVVTFAMIDRVHGRPKDTAKRSFNENSPRFAESEDFYRVTQPDEIRTLGFTRPQGGTAASVILITKRGYLKIAKTLGDDKAWEVFDEMLERYFAVEQRAAFALPQTFAEALRLAAQQSEQIEKQAAALAEMLPKAEFHDDVANAVNSQPFMDVAKVMGTGRTRFTRWLRERSFLMENNRPYQSFIEAGYFKVIEKKRKDPISGEIYTYPQTLITGKGITYLQKKWAEDHSGSAAE